MNHYDIIINGSGIVGLVAACALAESSLKIAILDKTIPQPPTDDFDLRVYAITRASQRIFQELHVWSDIAKRVSPYTKMNVWDSTGNGAIHFDCRDLGEPNCGHIIENFVIQQALFEKVKSYQEIDVIAPVNLISHEFQDGIHSLIAENNVRFSAPLIIGADGAHSWLRQQVKIECHTWSYGHEGIIGAVKSEFPHEKVARQGFLPQGPLAFLPLRDPHTCSIVWSTQTEHAQKLLAMSENEFNHALSDAFSDQLGQCEMLSERVSFPLHMRHAKTYVKEGIALIGDAAHTIHPLAGQGVNLGILDAVSLARVVTEAVKKDRNYFSHYTLSRYERERKVHNVGMIALMEGFKQLFSWQNPLAKMARNVGLNVTNRLTPIKRQLIWKALGAQTVEFE